MARELLKVAVDWDGVVVKKDGLLSPRNWAKRGLPPNEGVQAGLELITAQHDVHMMGIYTARPEWYRGSQTRKQRDKLGIPVKEIHHVKGHYAAKVGEVLTDAANPASKQTARLSPPPDLSRVLLIDDDPAKLLRSVEELSDKYAPMLNKLTIVAFGKKAQDVEQGVIIPGSGFQVVSMEGWSPKEVFTMLKTVREHAGRDKRRVLL